MTASPSTRRRSPLRQHPTRDADRSRTIAAASGPVTPLRRADAKVKSPMTEIDLPVAAEARSVRDSNKSHDEKFKTFQLAEPTLANRVIYGEVSLLEAQKLAEENAARLDRLGWWNVLQTMEPYTRLFADNLLAKLDKALTEHPDEC